MKNSYIQFVICLWKTIGVLLPQGRMSDISLMYNQTPRSWRACAWRERGGDLSPSEAPAPRWASCSQLRAVLCWVTQSCLTLCDPTDCVAYQAPLSMGILQARILEWVALPSSREIFLTQGLNPGLLHCRWVLYHLSHQGSFTWPLIFMTTQWGRFPNGSQLLKKNLWLREV